MLTQSRKRKFQINTYILYLRNESKERKLKKKKIGQIQLEEDSLIKGKTFFCV